MPNPYATIPSKPVFEKDSWFLTAHRSREPLTLQIDQALENYHSPKSDDFSKQFALVSLFWACDRWLKHVDGGTNQHFAVDSRRRPAVYELYKTVVQELKKSTGIEVNMLPNWLEMTFGRAMGLHGIDLDVRDGLAKTLTSQELERYRLQFSGGRAYQKNWWERGNRLVPADSKTCTMVSHGTVESAGSSGYVLTLGQDFYMAPHFVVNSKSTDFSGNFYHSSYRGGGTVACAGTIQIQQGEIKEITNDSGHYRPTTGHLVFAVETLRLLGVNMSTLHVKGFGLSRQSGTQLLASVNLQELASKNQEAYEPLDRDRQTALRAIETKAAAAALKKKEALDILLAHWGRLGEHKGIPKEFQRAKCPTCKAQSPYWDEAARMLQV